MAAEPQAGRLTGKVALITGGAGNIGEVITRRYLSEGATVVITGRNVEKLNAYRQRLIDEQGVLPEHVLAIRMDGSNIAEVRAGVAEVIERLGQIDVLVNNAGSAGARTRITDIPLTVEELQAPDTETLSQSIGNLLGISWNLTRVVAPYLKPGASVINVSTIFSRTDYYGRIPYVVPKAALNALSLAMASELGAQGVRVNTIYPGPIDSERIDSVFESMDGLKGEADGSTAESFFAMMRLSRPDETGTLVKAFPKTLDVANIAVFLGSDESAAMSGQALEITNGMAVPIDSRTSFIARPELRTVDAEGQVMLIVAGDQIEEALALAGVLRFCRAEVALAFRQRNTITRIEQVLEETRHLQGQDYSPPLLVYLNPLDPQSVSLALEHIQENTGGPHGVVILPAHAGFYGDGTVIGSDDKAVTRFMEDEIAGTIALASQLARFWQQTTPESVAGPRVVLMSNADDGKQNAYNAIMRAANEELVRVWRHEASIDAERTGTSGRGKPVWINQIVRYTNHETEGLDFACAWAARLLTTERKIEEITLELPPKIVSAADTQRPTFGWAERLFGLHTGKVVLITGGSAGIGGQVGRLLALSGARVMLAARGAEQLDQLRATIVRELQEAGYSNAESRVQTFANCDVGDESTLVKAVEVTLTAFGRIDYLINNAGIAGVEEMVIDMPIEGWRHTLNANLISNYSLIRKIAPLMKRQGSGYILNVSSYFGGEKYVAIPYPNRADYAVSKAGQRAMVEALARFMGPQIQINAIAPGPVEGDRLRGTGERPGLFMRRGRLILENKRLNDIHAALIEAQRNGGPSVATILPELMSNSVEGLGSSAHAALRKLSANILDQSDPAGSSHSFLMHENILKKLVRRLQLGGYLAADYTVPGKLPPPPDPFLTAAQIEREARKVRDGVLGMLYLQRMPTEFDVAMATVYYLADRAVTGETFLPSGGLKLERTVTEGELFGKASPQRLELLQGRTVYLIGEHLRRHLIGMTRAFIDECGVARVVLLTETEQTANELLATLEADASAGRVVALACGDRLEETIDRAVVEYGRPGPVVSTPFRPLPTNPLTDKGDGDWIDVLTEEQFAAVVDQNLTHHFRVARKVSLMDDANLVLVTPETSAKSTSEEFALANFIKTTLHALTATLGAESERTVHHVPVNQVDLTRRSRNEEPRGAVEEEEELTRFVSAVLLTSAPLPTPKESRYRARIYRGNAITV